MSTSISPTLEGSNLKLQPGFKGEIILPGENGYDKARTIWNGMIDHHPSLIARCTDENDVILAVNLARENKLLVSVKGGGHNVAGNAVCEKGLMIDLSPMKKVVINHEEQIANVEPGVTWKELDEATLPFALGVPGGTISDTGIAGLTLGGGVGYLGCKYGMTADNLIAADIVTAKGDLLHINEKNHGDLFWAIRGGGGNFGIVTKFVFQLHPVNRTVVAGMLLFPMEKAKQTMQFYRDFVRKAPDELMSYAGFITTPEGLPVCAIIPAWMGDIEKAGEVLKPLRNFDQPIADLIDEIPYTSLQTMLDASAPAGMRRYWKSAQFPELTDELLDILIESCKHRPSPFTPILFFHMRGEMVRKDPAAIAYPHRRDQWDSSFISQWTDKNEDEINIDWTRDVYKKIEPFTSSVYVNHLDGDDYTRIRSAYGPNYDRLKELKQKYDPENFFRLNNNIAP